MLSKNNVAGYLFLCVLLLVHLPVMAESNKITFATGEWVPYTSESLENYGSFTEKITRVLKEMGESPEYRFYPWRRCYDAVIKARVMAAFPYSYTFERAEQVWFSEPISCSKTVFFYYSEDGKDKDFQFNELADLKNYRIGGIAGYYYEEMFQKAGLEIDLVNKEINGIEKLKIGRIELMPVNEEVGWNLIRSQFPESQKNFKTLKKPLSVNALRLIVSREYPGAEDFLARFNAALKQVEEKGIIQLDPCEE